MNVEHFLLNSISDTVTVSRVMSSTACNNDAIWCLEICLTPLKVN